MTRIDYDFLGGAATRPLGARAFWYEAQGTGAIRELQLKPLQPGEVRIRTLWSAVSRGTERIVFNGSVPQSEHARMRGPMQEGNFPFPVKYGYCAVGRVEAGPPEWLGRIVFAMHPHQDHFNAQAPSVTAIPDHIPPRRAVLAANMETALNAVWDSGAGPGDRIVIVGGGLVGLLVAALTSRLPGAEVIVSDITDERRNLVEKLGARFVNVGADMPAPTQIADIVFHASGSQAGLATALQWAGFEAMVIELSWHGSGRVSVPLGGAFHSQRLKIVASQVGHVSSSRRMRWSASRRLSKAIDLLDDNRLDDLITAEVSFDDLPRDIAAILAPSAPGVSTIVRYQEQVHVRS